MSKIRVATCKKVYIPDVRRGISLPDCLGSNRPAKFAVMSPPQVKRVIVLGGGSAGFMVALTLKRKLPNLHVQVVRSPALGVIGVGEGTTVAFPKHFFEYLKLKPQQFYAEAEPTWKLGIKFLWGPRPQFYYTFAYEFQQRLPDLARNNGFYFNDDCGVAGPVSSFIAEDKAFPKGADGKPIFHKNHAFHMENKKLVEWLENVCRTFGVE